MDNEKIFYFDGTSARATEVRVLLFNESINLYEAETNNLISGQPIKAVTVSKTGDNLFVYLNDMGSAYLQLHSSNEKAGPLLDEVNKLKHGWVKTLMHQKTIVLIGVAIGLILGIYFLLIMLIPAIGSSIITRDAEVQMGNRLREMMLKEESIIGSTIDSAGTIKLQAIADQIELSDKYPMRVTLVKSKVVNAYALPGGQIVVYTGMLEKISDPASLVALLAHEASHINERHSLRSMLRSAADAIIVSVIFNDVSGVTGAIVGHAQTLKGLEYSRSRERDADEYGMQLMVRNNVDVSGMKTLMQMLQKEGDIPENISFLSSHPLTRERIRAAEVFIKNHPQKSVNKPSLQKAFQELKSTYQQKAV